MATKEVRKVGDNYHIGEAVITPKLLAYITSLQEQDHWLLEGAKASIADAICVILCENSNEVDKYADTLVDLATIRLNFNEFINK